MTTPLTARGRATRQRLVEGAAAEFRRRGVAATTLDDVLAATRTSKGQLFQHDCSTLGGNSGSCVVDLDSEQVIGLHFQGTYLDANWAVTLAKLATDPLIEPNLAYV